MKDPVGIPHWKRSRSSKPSFKPDGRVTAGNAPGLNDAAAALVVASQSQAEAMGAKVLTRIVAYAQAAVDPKYIFAAPARAIPLLLEKTGWTLSDVDLIELNEAFAAQILANGSELSDQGWDWNKVNVHGGAIALGHPLGATGARLLTTLIHALKDRGLKRGIASLCLGGGEAVGIGGGEGRAEMSSIQPISNWVIFRRTFLCRIYRGIVLRTSGFLFEIWMSPNRG